MNDVLVEVGGKFYGGKFKKLRAIFLGVNKNQKQKARLENKLILSAELKSIERPQRKLQ